MPPAVLPVIGVKLLTLVGFQVPLETIVVVVVVLLPSCLVVVNDGRKRVKNPPPLGVLLESTEPLPSSNR